MRKVEACMRKVEACMRKVEACMWCLVTAVQIVQALPPEHVPSSQHRTFACTRAPLP
jgi:hypothetical protein